MKFETIHNQQIPKIGFGCWSIGGMSTAEPAWDQHSLMALHSALDLGYTHFDTAESYANGHSEELLGRAIREKESDGRIFLLPPRYHQKIYDPMKCTPVVKEACANWEWIIWICI